MSKHARVLCTLHHPLFAGNHQPQHHISEQAEIIAGRVPASECDGDGVSRGVGERGTLEIVRQNIKRGRGWIVSPSLLLGVVSMVVGGLWFAEEGEEDLELAW